MRRRRSGHDPGRAAPRHPGDGMIAALVFDFDGLMVDTESPLVEAYGAVHAHYGVPFERKLFLRNVGHADFTFDPWHAFEKRADRVRLETERRERHRELDKHLPALPGVIPLLESARAAGLRLGVASNSSHGHVEGHLGRLRLLQHFEYLACREDAGSPKPEPDLYRLVLNRFGLSGRATVAFEDSQAGSLAARRAGLWVVVVPNPATEHHAFDHADWKIASLAEVRLPELMSRFSTIDPKISRNS